MPVKWRASCSSAVFTGQECGCKAPVALPSAFGEARGEAVLRLQLKPARLQRLPGPVCIDHLLV